MRYLIKSLVIFLFFICADKDNTFYLIRQVLSSIFDKTISILSNILDKIRKNNLDNTLEIPYRFHHTPKLSKQNYPFLIILFG